MIINNAIMETINLEEVFCDSGVPKYTFVIPNEYTRTKVALRTKGRGVVVEGPSGIGKTTCIKRILEETGISACSLSARIPRDVAKISSIINNPEGAGVVIIDDFHLLSDNMKKSLSDLLKVLADEAREDVKLVLIGINRAGECLVQLAPDLNNRIDTIRFEKNPSPKILELVSKGEAVLNISIKCKNDIAERSFGSFHVAQMLCKAFCISQDITETQPRAVEVTTAISDVVNSQMEELARVFSPTAKAFAAGNRNRRDGRAPYLMLLRWLSETENGALQMDEVYMKYPKYKASISQISDKGYITQLITNNDSLAKVLYYEPAAKLLAIEDPKFIFYIKNINWDRFAKDMGFKQEPVNASYDFALSFSGQKRIYAEKLFAYLTENEYSVFYDKDHAADILGKDLEQYFAPIYESDARYVVAMIDASYPQKVWAVFESERYQSRYGKDTVIPILFEDFTPSPTDTLFKRGYERLDSSNPDIDGQISRIGKLLIEKMNF